MGRERCAEKAVAGRTWGGPAGLNGSECFLLLSFKQNLWPYFFEITKKRNDPLELFPMPKGKLETDLKSWPSALRNIYIINQGWGAPNVVIATWMPKYLSFKTNHPWRPTAPSGPAAKHSQGFRPRLFIWWGSRITSCGETPADSHLWLMGCRMSRSHVFREGRRGISSGGEALLGWSNAQRRSHFLPHPRWPISSLTVRRFKGAPGLFIHP